MFNTTYNHASFSQVIDIKPACVGTIQKSSPLSRIVKCHIDSEFAKNTLDEFNPHISKKEWHHNGYGGYETHTKIPIIVLQVMVFGDKQCLIEFMLEEDYNKSMEVNNESN
jgi:hypothetical protein